MINKRLILFASLLFSFLPGKAQFDVQFSQYWGLMGYYNPAYAGQTDKLNIAGSYSQQLMGFTNAPKSMYFGADMPFKFVEKKFGVGAGFFNEGIGLFRNQRFWTQYSYKIKLNAGQLAIGVQLGTVNVSFDPTNINLGDTETDEAFPTLKVTGNSFDAGLGAYYNYKDFYLGLSAAHINAPTVKLGENNELKIDPLYYLTGGCNIKTKSSLISIQPSFLLKSDLVTTKVDLTARLLYSLEDKVYYGGLSYSPGTSVTFLLGMKIKKITVGYAYDMFTSKIGVANGSHDLFVNYVMDLKFSGNSKNKHKSIRIL